MKKGSKVVNTTKTCKFLQKLLEQKTKTLSNQGITRVTIQLLRNVDVAVTRKKIKGKISYLVYFFFGELEFEFNVSSEKIGDILEEIEKPPETKKTRTYTTNDTKNILSYNDDNLDSLVCY
jgi:hypothetical protein